MDLKARVVQLANLATNSVAVVGRNGKGPGEYLLPTGLVPMPGDRTFISDPASQRFLVVGGDGKPQGMINFDGHLFVIKLGLAGEGKYI